MLSLPIISDLSIRLRVRSARNFENVFEVLSYLAIEVFWGVFQIVILLAFFNPWRSARHFTLSNFSIISKNQLYFKICFGLIL